MQKLKNRPGETLDRVFAALSDPTRRGIVEQLTEGEATVGAIAEPYDMALPSISKHVKVLEAAGLIKRTVVGRQHWLSLSGNGFAAMTDWFTGYEEFWTKSIDRLEALLDQLSEGGQE